MVYRFEFNKCWRFEICCVPTCGVCLACRAGEDFKSDLLFHCCLRFFSVHVTACDWGYACFFPFLGLHVFRCLLLFVIIVKTLATMQVFHLPWQGIPCCFLTVSAWFQCHAWGLGWPHTWPRWAALWDLNERGWNDVPRIRPEDEFQQNDGEHAHYNMRNH